MTTSYSEKVSEWTYEKWNFIGRKLELQEHGEWGKDNPDGIGVDDYLPMMLYAYPLHSNPSNNEIREVHRKTNCTVVQKKSTGDRYLALTGGGMDMSQDIALAYLLTDNRIPSSLTHSVLVKQELTVHGDDYQKVLKGIKDTLETEKSEVESKIKKVEQQLSKTEGE